MALRSVFRHSMHYYFCLFTNDLHLEVLPNVSHLLIPFNIIELLWKWSINGDGKQFRKYQQKRTTTPLPKSMNTKSTDFGYNIELCEKSLKIPKRQSESVNRRTDNTMAKRKNTKGQTTIYKTKDQVTRTPLKTGAFLEYLYFIFRFRSQLFWGRAQLVQQHVINIAQLLFLELFQWN